MKNLKKKDIFLHLIFFVAGSCVSLSIYIHIEPCVIKHVEPATQMVAPIVLAAREQKICARKNDTMLTLNEPPCVCNRRVRETIHTSPQWTLELQQKMKSLERFERRKICMDDIYNYVDGRSPVSYPAHGLYVMPLRAVLIKVLLRYLEFNITIPIHIQHRQVPWLYRKGTVEERVTVIVKTFLRYHKAKSAIFSIKRLYPNTRIIIADDTPLTNFTNLQGINMDHFRMPGFTGYFAGRNLGLSQVWTEYFLYMDDDLFFTNGTRLDVLVSFLDKTNFHLVSGAAEGKKRHVHTLRVLGNGTYSCHRKEQRHYNEIKGFPGCFVADLVPNFFLGSTHEVKSIGFDPHPALSRVGHYAFFLSALGRIRIAFCTTVEFGHNKTTTEADAAYRGFRYVGPEYYKMRGHYELFKYNFAC
ncbi:beta-1,4 N-acetylgalactosaminyltransferase 1-like isoform X3 [Branchiostoma floridae x Branchiostoma belcheri]